MIFEKLNGASVNVFRRVVRQTCGVIVVAVIFTLTLNAQSRQMEMRQANPPRSEAQAAPHANERKANPMVAAPNDTATSAPVAGASSAIRYAYEFKQPQFVVSSIIIEHDAAGRGRMTFTKRGIDETFAESVALSPSTLARIIELWTRLNFLKDKPALQAEKQFPHLGTMILRVNNANDTRAAEFNWTTNTDAAALAGEYRRLADQTLFIFDINVARENQPLEAPAIMKRLESLVRRKEISDPEQLLPFLRDLSTDERLPLIARNQANNLAKKLDKK